METPSTPASRKSSLFTLFFTVFLDLLGLGIIIPVLAPLFLNPEHGILPVSYEFSARTFALGLLIASYPLAQFFGAPVLGGLSDKYGRRKILLIALVGTMIGYILFALGIVYKSLFLLFASRILDGFTGGNVAIIQSAIADMSDAKSRNKNFGLIGMAFGLGFILGPYVGGKLADPAIVSWFNFATPFWFAALLAAINIGLVIWKFPETLKKASTIKISLFTGFHNIGKAFTMGNLRTMFIVIFLMTFGFNFFTQFFQVFLVDKFQFTQGDIGDMFAYVGVWIAITQGLLTRTLARYASSTTILSFTILLSGLTFPLLLIPSTASGIYWVIPFIAIFQGLSMPNYTAIVSNLSDDTSQGEVLGISQSIQSLGQAIPPIVAGAIVSVHRDLPITIAGIATCIAWLVYMFFFKRSSKESFHEVS